jgi:hypothetical protein
MAFWKLSNFGKAKALGCRLLNTFSISSELVAVFVLIEEVVFEGIATLSDEKVAKKKTKMGKILKVINQLGV